MAGAVLSVRMFGAQGDGVTDDTDAIQRTIDAAQLVDGYVYLPGGTYLVSFPGENDPMSATVPQTAASALVVNGKCHIRGDGQQKTIITGDSKDVAILEVAVLPGSPFHIQIEDIGFQFCNTGVYFSGGSAAVIGAYDIVRNCETYACNFAGLNMACNWTGSGVNNLRMSGGGYGIYCEGIGLSNYSSIERCYFSYLNIAGIYIGDSVTVGSGAGSQYGIRIRDCQFDFINGHGIHFLCNSGVIDACYFESCGTSTTGGPWYDIMLDTNWDGVSANATIVRLLNADFDIPGQGQLVAGAYLAPGSSYNRIRVANPVIELEIDNARTLQTGLLDYIVNDSGSLGRITLNNAPFFVNSGATNYAPYGQRHAPGYIGTGVLTVSGATPTSIGLDSAMNGYGGAALVMCTQGFSGAAKAGLYFIRCANALGVGFLKTFVTGDDIALFTDTAGKVSVAAADSGVMEVSTVASHIGSPTYRGL